MNPYSIILNQFYNDQNGVAPWQGMDGAVVLVLKIMEANYSTGWDGVSNPYRYVLNSLAIYGRNAVTDKAAVDWNSRLNK